MANFVFTVNGFNMAPYIAHGGVKWSRYDVDGPSAGRNIRGDMIRDRVATKIKLEVTCIPLRDDELQMVLQAIEPEFVTVRYVDPMWGTRTTTMYANNNSAELYWHRGNNGFWTGVSFPLVEK